MLVARICRAESLGDLLPPPFEKGLSLAPEPHDAYMI